MSPRRCVLLLALGLALHGPAALAQTAAPDLDNDGYAVPADCNDTVATIHPGAPEVLNDTIDQDCDGQDKVDQDYDGYYPPADCNDHDFNVHPGALERPGNHIDEDCDGTDPPAVASIDAPASGGATTPAVKPAQVITKWDTRGRLSRVALMVATDLPHGASVGVTCRGGRCPLRSAMPKVLSGAADLTGLFRNRWLPRSTRIVVTVTLRDGTKQTFRPAP